MTTSISQVLRRAALATTLLLALASHAQAVKYTVREVNAGSRDVMTSSQSGVTYTPAGGSPVSMSLLPNATYVTAGPDASGNVFVFSIQLNGGGRPPQPRGPSLDPQKTALWNVKTGQITAVEWPYGVLPGNMTSDGTMAVPANGPARLPPFIWNIKTGFTYLDAATPGATAADRFSSFVSTPNGPDSAGRWMINGFHVDTAESSSFAVYLWQPGVSVKQVMGPYSKKYPETVAVGFNDKGQVVGRAGNGFQNRPFVWVPKIGYLPLSLSANSNLYPGCLNNAGQVTGYESSATGADKAFIWTLFDGVKYLTNLLDAQSKQYTVISAGCVDALGRIPARAYTPDTDYHWVVLEPAP